MTYLCNTFLTRALTEAVILSRWRRVYATHQQNAGSQSMLHDTANSATSTGLDSLSVFKGIYSFFPILHCTKNFHPAYFLFALSKQETENLDTHSSSFRQNDFTRKTSYVFDLLSMSNMIHSTIIVRRRRERCVYYTAARIKCPVSHKICGQYVCRHLYYPNLAHYFEVLNFI